MECPRCKGHDLMVRDHLGIEVDACRNCQGMWLDYQELDQLEDRVLDDDSVKGSMVYAERASDIVLPQVREADVNLQLPGLRPAHRLLRGRPRLLAGRRRGKAGARAHEEAYQGPEAGLVRRGGVGQFPEGAGLRQVLLRRAHGQNQRLDRVIVAGLRPRHPTRRGDPWSLFHKSSPMIYAKHFKTLFDDLPRESMEYGPKVHPFYESRNPEGPILGEIRLMKHAPCGRPPTPNP